MENENKTPELDAFLSDLRRLLDDDTPPDTPVEEDLVLTELLTELEPSELTNQAEPQAAENYDFSDVLSDLPEPQPEPAPEPEQPAVFQQTRWTDRQRVPRHVAKLQRNQEQAYADWLYEQENNPQQPPPPELTEPTMEEIPLKKKSHGLRNFLIFLLVLTLGLLAVVIFVLPQQPAGVSSLGTHRSDAATILILGTDQSGARTDVAMLLSVDRGSRQLSLVSIPRDTLVNGEYSVPKLSSVYAVNNGGSEGIEMVMTRVSQCIGYTPDGYILVDLAAFEEFVDALGGVRFQVPVDMYYNDESQGLHIALEAGMQTLSGEEALGVVRFRNGYADADLGRVQVQRDFLSALIRQTVSAEGIVKSPMLLQILLRHCTTDLSAGNLLWLAESALLSDFSNIQTATLPGTARMIGDGSYYVLDPASVAQTVNTYCNPYAGEVTTEDLDIRLH